MIGHTKEAEMKVKTKDGKDWVLEEIYTAGGIKVEATGSTYAGIEIQDRKYDNQGHKKYGYYNGTDAAAEARGLKPQTANPTQHVQPAPGAGDKLPVSRATSHALAELTQVVGALQARQERYERSRQIEIQTDIRSLEKEALGCYARAKASKFRKEFDLAIDLLFQAKVLYKQLNKKSGADVSTELGRIARKLEKIERIRETSLQGRSSVAGNPSGVFHHPQSGLENTREAKTSDHNPSQPGSPVWVL